VEKLALSLSAPALSKETFEAVPTPTSTLPSFEPISSASF